MKRIFLYITAGAALLLGCPLCGVFFTDRPLSAYLEFPPRTIYVQHASFSWPVFCGLAAFVMLCLAPFTLRLLSVNMRSGSGAGGSEEGAHHNPAGFPWWGWAGVLCVGIGWVFAWTRLPWLSSFQHYTYPPLWLGYIVAVNGLTYKRTGRCMLTHRPVFFLVLFPVSAAFWWFFEYLNRFVQNWYYLAVSDFGPLEYALFASVCFSTVIPAVLGTRDYVMTFGFFTKAFGAWRSVPGLRSSGGWFVLIIAAAGLFCIGIYPNVLFPLLWVAPLLVVLGMQKIGSQEHIFSPLARGDWTGVAAAACGALICGFFWEMWNYYSLAKWVYMVPYVQKFHLFEMPALGYAGYLPFGLECAVIGDLVSRRLCSDASRNI